MAGKPTFFATPADLRRWFAKNAASTPELLVGFHKKGSGKPSITWPESVDEALCVGWIDGVRRRIDDTSYTIRFTPRRPGSIWSAINIAKVKELTAAGRMKPAGLAAFAARRAEGPGYSYKQLMTSAFAPEQERRFRKNAAAWRFFSAQPPGYRQHATYWVVSAKKDDTRERRLATLIADSAAGRRLARLQPKKPPGV